MFVDDDKKNFDSIRRLFSLKNINLLPYEDLPEDINDIYQRALDNNVDFVIIDFDLGKQAVNYTGIDVLKNIREQDADIDDLICSALSEIGSVECVDRDYDLFYEWNIYGNKYLCYVEIAEVTFEIDGSTKKFISTEKLGIWEGINEKEKILIIIFNKNDQNIYFVKLDEILGLAGAKNVEKCAYFLKEENQIDKLSLAY